MTDAGLLLRVLGGVSYLASFENMAKVEAAIGAEPNAVRRLGALAVAIPEDAERLWQKLRLANNEHERLASMGEKLGAYFADVRREGRQGAALPVAAAEFHRSRIARLGALRLRQRTMRNGARLRHCRSAGPRRCFR